MTIYQKKDKRVEEVTEGQQKSCLSSSLDKFTLRMGGRWCKMNSYLDQIKNRINDFDSRKVFINNDFLDIAGNETVRRTLNQLVSKNKKSN